MIVGSQNPLINHGYQIGPSGQPELKPMRPRSIGDARKQISQVFDRLKWDADSQKRYFALKGVDANKVDDLTPEQVRSVLGFLEASSMILYRD